MKPILYIDIDGVLLTKKQMLPNYLEDFLPFIISKFDCYWLTTHCKGDKATATKYLKKYYPKTLLPFIEKINVTNWSTLKTEAIDFKNNFLWLDDYVLESEKQVLTTNNCLQSLILIDFKANPDSLKDFIKEGTYHNTKVKISASPHPD